jgi:hypothetical protein
VVERGFEGYVAKDEASVYEGGATRRWLKVKQKGWTVEEGRTLRSAGSRCRRARWRRPSAHRGTNHHSDLRSPHLAGDTRPVLVVPRILKRLAEKENAQRQSNRERDSASNCASSGVCATLR